MVVITVPKAEYEDFFLYFVFQGEKNYYRMEQYKGKLIWLDDLMMINPLK